METQSGIKASRALETGRGLAWIREGFALFMAMPLAWIINTILFLLIMIVLGLIPFVSLLGTIISPVFFAGIMLGCRSLEEGGELAVSHLFAGFGDRGWDLVKAGLLYLGLILGVTFIMFLVLGAFGLAASIGGAEAATPQLSLGMLVVIFVATLATIPVVMGFMFSPALLIFNPGLGVVDAYKSSFLACLKNILPFTVFGLLVIVLSFLAMIPLFLGLLVFIPTMFGATYVAYMDMFGDEVATGEALP